jgi:hypothetical protein
LTTSGAYLALAREEDIFHNPELVELSAGLGDLLDVQVIHLAIEHGLVGEQFILGHHSHLNIIEPQEV